MRTIQFGKTPRQEKGSTLVLVVIFIVVLFAFAALSIDMACVYQQERDMQSATDVAALSAVQLLTNRSASATSVIQQALTLARANGVSAGEVAASNVGTIEVGTWNTNALVFTANTPQSQWNAVLVPAKRNVPLVFARVVGMGHMTPHAQSVAMEGGLRSVSGLIPFGVTTNELHGLTYGGVIDTGIVSPGDRGKINLCGLKMSSDPNFQQYMVSGVDCAVFVGSQWDPGPGNSAFQAGFDDRLAVNPFVTMPIVDAFPNGNSGQVTIEGFVQGMLLSSGGKWNGQIQLLSFAIGGVIGGPTNMPYAQVRVLVQ